MKKILILLTLIIVSCSKEEPCDCTKTSYEIEQYTYFQNGLPKIGVRTVTSSIKEVGCEDEGRTETGSNSYYIINCY